MADVTEQVDLTHLSDTLALCFRGRAPAADNEGRKAILRMIERLLGCSTPQARALSRALKQEKLLRPSRSDRSRWQFKGQRKALRRARADAGRTTSRSRARRRRRRERSSSAS